MNSKVPSVDLQSQSSTSAICNLQYNIALHRPTPHVSLMPPHGTNLTITNPLILYRSLIATNQIKPDPAQHRLALHLQKLYERLIDYEPSLEYSQRLRQLSRVVGQDDPSQATTPSPGTSTSTIGTKGIWTSLLARKEERDSLALTRVLTSHDAAIHLQSPQGLMLHGEVGTGKSMLIDLFADCLPNRKKRRCHFNTFMLDTISRLEQLRKAKLAGGSASMQDEYSLLWLARDLIQKSPILFLDEFQLPDRVASKILSNLMTSFFQLGGVLIATSNRMPEELAKAAGMDFARPVSRVSRLGWTLGLGGTVGRDDGPGQLGEFAKFLEVLRARCEVWEMEGKEDYRRLSGEEDGFKDGAVGEVAAESTTKPASGMATSLPLSLESSTPGTTTASSIALPKNYFIEPSATGDPNSHSAYTTAFNDILTNATSHPQPTPWTPTTLTVYGRPIPIPATYAGTALFTFSQICGAVLGPADYITLASTYHTFIITQIPVLTFHQKNEARRFITLLDALYEAKCRLVCSAEKGVDDLFFPTPPASTSQGREAEAEEEIVEADATHPETYSEIHQDLTSPFRPNISSYSPTTTTTSSSSTTSFPSPRYPSLSPDALEDDPPNRTRRPNSSFTDERSGVNTKALDFANIRGLTGEDEVFAVKRAQSRIWEMCSGKWWARGGEEDGPEAQRTWWRPLPLEARHWERGMGVSPALHLPLDVDGGGDVTGGGASDVRMRPGVEVEVEFDIAPRGGHQKALFPHEGASPFRTSMDAPPRFNWTHVWGTIQWGKRAGAWGKGVDGLGERKKIKDSEGEGGERTERTDKKGAR
ncbi:hypothetical protein K505DRAFT_80852 [Melanomma pulvis-pyrius CBS 109.77]|uniref:AAA+ ATPase domain-containing protein n=1 Tax=Melanomma pulvis-pyrius CBS 109.77 TaxID=1314802 RepID=A0A6A6XS61_9PLEO|nr:hypothetical protein K505DRAFT_80852 [Melanomma pulvis-pyrius CBS 109.77]